LPAPLENYSLTLSLNGTQIAEDLVAGPLNPGETYTHTFSNTVDLSAIGDYTLSATITHPDDEAPFNNSTESLVQQLLSRDAAVIALEGDAATCITPSPYSLEIRNEGFETITEAVFAITVNGTDAGTATYTGELEFEEIDILEFEAALDLDINTIDVVIQSINGNDDQNEANNQQSVETDFFEGEGFVFTVLTDDYPEETTWTIANSENGDIIAEGGPYQLSETEYARVICLQPDDCFTLVVFDAFGDGICCDFGEGSYNLSYDGTILFEGGEFESTISHSFCGDGTIVGIEENALNEDQYNLNVYPNPTEDLVQLELTTSDFESNVIEIEVYDIQGKQILRDFVSRYGNTYKAGFSLYKYPKGLYHVRLRDGAKSVSTSIVRQ